VNIIDTYSQKEQKESCYCETPVQITCQNNNTPIPNEIIPPETENIPQTMYTS
jgi:hypothetical protein